MSAKVCALPSIQNCQLLAMSHFSLGANDFSLWDASQTCWCNMPSLITSETLHPSAQLVTRLISSFLCMSLQVVSGQMIGTRAFIAFCISIFMLSCWAAAVISLRSLVIIAHAQVTSCSKVMLSILNKTQRIHLMCCDSPEIKAQAIHHSQKSRSLQIC